MSVHRHNRRNYNENHRNREFHSFEYIRSFDSLYHTKTRLTFVYREVMHVIGSTYGRLKEAPDIESSALPVRSRVIPSKEGK